MDRTNMVSLLDVGSLLGGQTSKILEMGDGYSELSEDWGPNIKNTQWVNMKSAASAVSGYQFSMSPSREYMSDDLQKELDKIFKKFPTGKECETTYYRFLKTDKVTESEGKYAAIAVPVVVAASSMGGSGGDALTSGISIQGNGEVKEGFITLSESGYTWSET